MKSENSVKNADMVWGGLDDSRQRLFYGLCTLSGMTTKHGETREENCLIAFDNQNGFYRFDRIGVANSLLTPEYYFECWDPETPNSAMDRQPSSTRITSHKVDLFDIRMLGFFTFLDAYNDLRYDKDTITNFLKNKELVEFKQNDNGVIAITYVVTPERITLDDDEKTRQTYWIDPSNGFSLMMVEYRHSDGDADKTEITWEEKNGVWVPVSCLFSSDQGFSGTWKFDWLLVNEPVPPHFFEVANLSETPVRLFTREFGEPIQIGIAGGDEGYYLYPSDEQHNPSPFPRIILWLGIFLIIIALGKKVYDYWRSRVSV